jgi:cysteine synthase
MALRLARQEGLLAGLSAGVAMVATLQAAQELESGLIATIFPDSGDKYLSERSWDEGH